MGNSMCWYLLVKCTQLFPVFTAKNLAPIFQAASRSRLHCPLQISHVASLPFFVSQYLVLSSPFGCRSTLPHPRQHLLVRNSDTATTSTLLVVVVGSHSQDLCNTLPTSNALKAPSKSRLPYLLSSFFRHILCERKREL